MQYADSLSDDRRQQLLADIVEHLPCGISVFDRELRHVISNTSARRLLGLPEAECGPGATLQSLARYCERQLLVEGGDGEERLARRLASIASREPQHLECLLRSGKAVELRGSFLPDGSLIFTSTDVTAARRSEDALRAAVAAADQASQAKSDFLATMSHEIRTPLNGVIGLTHLLKEAELPPTEADSVAMIDSCAKSLLSLVDNVLDFSKIEAGRISLEEVPTDLGGLVQELGDLFTVRAAEKGLRFEVRQAPGLPRWIAADPGRLRQILLNLLGNALKFTAHGHISLRVEASAQAGGAMLRFTVTDTGPGISEGHQARLFNRFTQVDTSASRRHQGTGLGLAISRQLAQLMGGDVTVVSRPGVGSQFCAAMPLRPSAMPAATAAAAAGAVRPDARILLAEDNEVNQLVACRMLALLGYPSVTTVWTGREALNACRRERFDLVLMDCQMPVMDGWEATRELRRMGVQVPILAFTASATSGDRDRCLGAGMDDYLTKPIEKAVLAEKMQRWLAHPAPRAAAPAPGQPQSRTAFDEQVLQSFFLGDAALYADARRLFLQDVPRALEQLGTHAPPEPERLRQAMHRIRGTASTLGATALARLCAELEEAPSVAPGRWPAALGGLREALAAYVAASAAVAQDALVGQP